MFSFLKKKEAGSPDFSAATKENVQDFVKTGQLQPMFLISPDFGGSTGVDNQIFVTPKAAKEKQQIDRELYSFLEKGTPVRQFHADLNYKEHSVVPSRILITAVIDGKNYRKEIEVW